MSGSDVVHGFEYRGVMIHILETREAIVVVRGEQQQFLNKYDAMDFLDAEIGARVAQDAA